jgi:beta-glucosidase
VTFPVSASQYPRPQIPGWGRPEKEYFDSPHPEGAAVGYRHFARTGAQPLFPFGFGLSYSRFEYKNLQVTGGKDLKLKFDVTNVGERAGSDTPQAYLVAMPGARDLRLIGFRRVALAPGATSHVEMTVDRRLLGSFDENAHQWRISSGTYEVAVGASSVHHSLRGSARLGASVLRP